jgi:ribosomal protein L21E
MSKDAQMMFAIRVIYKAQYGVDCPPIESQPLINSREMERYIDYLTREWPGWECWVEGTDISEALHMKIQQASCDRLNAPRFKEGDRVQIRIPRGSNETKVKRFHNKTGSVTDILHDNGTPIVEVTYDIPLDYGMLPHGLFSPAMLVQLGQGPAASPPAKHKYKVGDKVRGTVSGAEYVITGLGKNSGGGGLTYHATAITSGAKGHVAVGDKKNPLEDLLELVSSATPTAVATPSREFKVGDRVKVIASEEKLRSHCVPTRCKGQVGRIAFSSPDNQDYIVAMDDGRSWYMRPEFVELANSVRIDAPARPGSQNEVRNNDGREICYVAGCGGKTRDFGAVAGMMAAGKICTKCGV